MHELELVIFDLAGTTVEDCGEVPGAFIDALAAHGIHVSTREVEGVRGSSKREALRQFIPPGPDQTQRTDNVYASFRASLAGRYKSEGVRAVPGAVAAFRRLRARGVRVALNTGFDRDTTSLLIEALGWDAGMVDAVVCGDDVAQGRPAPYLIFRAMERTGATAVQSVANVGDTTRDLQAGHNAAVHWNIGVLSGAHPRQSLERAPHTHLIPSVADLDRVLGE